MSYEPTNWKSGDTVTSAKLNKMEQGIANAGGGNVVVVGVEVVNTENGATATFDKTFAELKTAHEGGAIMLCNINIEDEVSNLYWKTLSFLIHHAESQVPIPMPERFAFEASCIDPNGATQCCAVNGGINGNGTIASLFVQSLVS